MKEITYEIFCQACVTTPSEELYDRIRPMVRVALNDIMRMYHTEATLAAMRECEDLPLTEPRTPAPRAVEATVSMACTLAFYRAVPHIDLVLNDAGFGIVSTQNQAPASAERVNRLIAELDVATGRWHDALLDALRQLSGWGESDKGLRQMGSVVCLCSGLPDMGVAPRYSLLASTRSKAWARENELIALMGRGQYATMLSAMRAPEEMSAAIAGLLDRCREYVAAAMRGEAAGPRRMETLAWLEEHIDDFGEYRESPEYEANHFKGYENGKEDPCYFFG